MYCYPGQERTCFFEKAGKVYYADLYSDILQFSTTFTTVEIFETERAIKLIRITDQQRIEKFNRLIARKIDAVYAPTSRTPFDTQPIPTIPPKEPEFFQPFVGHNTENCYYEREGRVFWICLDRKSFFESACYTKDRHIDFINDIKTGKMQKITNTQVLDKIRAYLKELIKDEKIS